MCYLHFVSSLWVIFPTLTVEEKQNFPSSPNPANIDEQVSNSGHKSVVCPGTSVSSSADTDPASLLRR